MITFKPLAQFIGQKKLFKKNLRVATAPPFGGEGYGKFVLNLSEMIICWPPALKSMCSALQITSRYTHSATFYVSEKFVMIKTREDYRLTMISNNHFKKLLGKGKVD